MNEIREFLINYIVDKFSVDKEDVKTEPMCYLMDSLDIVDLIMEIETHYNFEFEEDFYETIGERTLDEIVEYIKQKNGGR